AHRGNPDRRSVAAAEQLDLAFRQRWHHAVARHELDRVEGRPVARDAFVGAGAAIAIFKRKAWDVMTGMLAQIGDGREALPQRAAAAIGGLLRRRHSQIADTGAVIHDDFSLPAQKWLNESCLNVSGLPSLPRKRGRALPLVMTPISTTGTPA